MDNIFYRAHNPGSLGGGARCRKQVQEEQQSGTFICRCGAKPIPVGQTLLQYMVRLCLADCSNYEWAFMFDAKSLFGMLAQDLHQLKEADENELFYLCMFQVVAT